MINGLLNAGMINLQNSTITMRKMNLMKCFLVVLAALLIFSTDLIAQNNKFGQDSALCVRNYSLYREAYNSRNFAEAIPYWKATYAQCPAVSEYVLLDGLTLIKVMMQGEKDKVKFNALIDTLLMVYDQRITYFGKEGFVLGRKGVDMVRLMPQKPEEAYNTLHRSYQIQGNKMEAPAADAYFMMALELVKRNKMTKEEAIDVYDRASDVVDANKHTEDAEDFKKAQDNMDSRIIEIADCALLMSIYGPKFKASPTDIALLKKITKMMDKRDCTSDPLYLEAAVNLDKQEPSAESKAKIGKMHKSKGNNSEAVKFFSQAAEMEQDPNQKAQYYFEISMLNLKSAQYSSARSNAQKASALRPNWGAPYLIIGDAYAASAKECGEDEFKQKAVYWIAVDKYQQAKSVDPTMASDANQRISTYSKYFPTGKDIFFMTLKEGESYTIDCWIKESTRIRAAQE
jgi:tetratricopeptide (TPR) repeat protein